MKRTKPIKRTAVKKVNPERRKREFARCYGSPSRVQWIAWQPSVVSGLRPCENAHVRNGGTGRKADARWIVPLTPAEHRELHRVGKVTFEYTHGVDLDYLAELTNDDWERMK